MKAVVTGATGFVGSFLCEHLAEQGHEVVAMVRATSNLRWIESLNLATACADICESGSLAGVVDGADVVYHVAGLVRADSRREFFRVNFDGTRNIAQACLSAGRSPKRLVFVSSQAAAGPSPGPEGIDEDCPQKPVSAYGESKLAAERYLAGLKGLEVVIVRPSMVYGPRDPETFSLFKIVGKLRLRPVLGGGRMLVSIIEVRDLAKGIRLAGETARAEGRTYFLSSPKPYLITDVLKEIAAALGRRTVGVPVSRLVISAGAELSAFLGQFVSGSARLSHLKAAELAQRCWVVRTERARSELGFEAAMPIAEGLKAAARWYVDNGWL